MFYCWETAFNGNQSQRAAVFDYPLSRVEDIMTEKGFDTERRTEVVEIMDGFADSSTMLRMDDDAHRLPIMLEINARMVIGLYVDEDDAYATLWFARAAA